ncbi:phosphoribosylformylglycinamidine cyclo-ligase [Candidatus Bathyarchaeota archaeon]|nr:MAG: phosphoribosylformylglycinamidine cyclo-ligase [Candidatus Bathyarchaeota archaeon]
MPSRYAKLGVDVKKRGVEAFKERLEVLFPEAFCPIQRDPDAPGRGLVAHTDSAGSKPVQSYLHWRETGDPRWFRGLAQDVVAMNLDDIICVGADPLCFLDYVALNPLKVDKEALLKALAEGFGGCFSTLDRYGVKVLFSGGETADLPDQMRTLDVSGSIFGRVDLEKVVTGQRIREGDLIVGLRSGGRTVYERGENSGIMCNGLTLARLSLMDGEYQRRYPELGEPGGRRYRGRFKFDDYLDELGMTVGEALLSPTRLYAPVVKRILERCGGAVHGLVHNTGGGVTKCLRVGRNIRYVKDHLPDPDPIFLLIQREAGVEWREMFEDYNMGIGFEVIVDAESAEEVLSVADSFKLGAQVIGRCERGEGEKALIIRSRFGVFRYP